jgi:acyl-homoserine lactone acylase PvdQ
MSKILKALVFVCLAFMLGLLTLSYLYRTTLDGEITLPKAPGVVKITREKDSEIAHIRGESFKAVGYGQGFAHA